MKPRILVFTIALLASFAAAAQSTNPLNYSGRIYVSYEDHAILSQQMRIPSVEITKCDMAFEKGTVTVKDNEMKIKVNGCRKYDTDYGWVVVVYVDLVDEGDKAELVWPEYGKPFFQQITKADDGVKIARMVLSRKPYVADEAEALRYMLMGLGAI